MKKIIIISLLFLSLHLGAQPLFNQQINLGNTYTSDQIINPFNGEIMYGLAIDGDVVLNSDSSLIRIVLQDNINQSEFLVFESYPMLDPELIFDFTEKYEETGYLDAFTPTSLKVLIVDAEITIDAIKYTSTPVENVVALQYQEKLSIDQQKISKLNTYLEDDLRMWRAGETPYSKMFYKNREKMWGEKYFMFGYEFYDLGVFEWGFKPANTIPMGYDYNYPAQFNWRDRHNANDSTSMYYDGDTLGTGWITRVKRQNTCIINDTINDDPNIVDECDCDSLGGIWTSYWAPCWAFSACGTAEATANLYYNDHIDYDISELDLAMCYHGVPTGDFNDAFEWMRDDTVVVEACFPYSYYYDSCDLKCEYPDPDFDFVTISDTNAIEGNEINFKNYIINNGPFSFSMFGHAWVMVGYDVLRGGTTIKGYGTIDWNNNKVGKTVWIAKDSYGVGEGDNGFKYFYFNETNGPSTYNYPSGTGVKTPVESINIDPSMVNCNDLDNDGFFYWGIGPKPSNCDPCPDEKDANDNNPGIGPFTENGFYSIIDSVNSSFEGSFDGWQQVGYDSLDWKRINGPNPTGTIYGPDAAQDGEEYLLIWSADIGGIYSVPYKKGIIESPIFNFDENICTINVSFWFYKNSVSWAAWQGSRFHIQARYKNTDEWTIIWGIQDGEQISDQWQNVNVVIPGNCDRIRFVGITGLYEYDSSGNTVNDIALDNISITPVYSDDIPHIINDTVHLLGNHYVCSDISIEPGGKLVLDTGCKLTMHPDVKIIIKRTGKLLLNEATISSLPGADHWHGIEIWGNSLSPDPLAQGMLELHEGVIKNAKLGIYTAKVLGSTTNEQQQNIAQGIYDNGYTGGAIWAFNSDFINCPVQIFPYNYDYTAGFDDCDFLVVTSSLPTIMPDYLCKMNEVEGIWFKSCTFRDNYTYPYTNGLYGIISHNADFEVKGKCTSTPPPGEECPNWDYSIFHNLKYGIYATSDDLNKTIYVDHTKFESVTSGVYISGINSAKILSSNFFISPFDNQTFKHNYGLYINNCTNYHIEANIFSGPSEPPPAEISRGDIGLYVNNSGTDYNQIYNNEFEFLNYAILTDGINRSPIFGSTSTGLCIECNDFIDNLNDIVVSGNPFGPSNQGIAYNQGYTGFFPDNELPAGNTFTFEDEPDLEYNYFIDNSCNNIQYVYHQNYNPLEDEIYPNLRSEDKVFPWEFLGTTYSKEDACPSTLDRSGDDELGLLSNINEAETNIDDKQNILQLLVDGGDTYETNMEVVTAYPEEALELRNYLLNKSPYLSDEVMQSAIENESVLEDAMLRDVLVANPQAAKSKSVMDAVYERFNPLPDYMIAQILGGMSIQGAKDQLNNELAYWHRIKADNFSRLYNLYLNDEEEPEQSYAELLNLLDADIDINSKYKYALHLLNSDQYAEAVQVLNNIESNFALSTDQDIIHQDYEILFNFLNGYMSDSTHTIETLQLDTLLMLTTRDNYLPGAFARNLLISKGLLEYDEPINIPELLKSSEAESWNIISMEPNSMKVYPNPANEYIIVEYLLDGIADQISIAISDLQGKKVFAKQLDYEQDKIIIETHVWKPGIYIVFLYKNGNLVKSEKVTIQ